MLSIVYMFVMAYNSVVYYKVGDIVIYDEELCVITSEELYPVENINGYRVLFRKSLFGDGFGHDRIHESQENEPNDVWEKLYSFKDELEEILK